MTSLATTQRGRHLEQAISRDASSSGLLERAGLLQLLDLAVTRRVTVVSAPPGSGKTSLLSSWAERSTSGRGVGVVAVDRDQQDAQLFWSGVLDAIRSAPGPNGPQARPAPAAALDADQLVDTLLWQLAS